MHQRKYVLEFIDQVDMSAVKPAETPIYANVKLNIKII